MTPAEERLWNSLRDRRLRGLKFRAQHALDRFVLDFYCASARLVVEVDGAVHDQQVERDNARTAALEAHGLRVVRFRNEEIMTNLQGVLLRIIEAAQT
jgi:very-short-patch-repair endonuclease